jgi:hypothetical protein
LLHTSRCHLILKHTIGAHGGLGYLQHSMT